jgi:hypothetical protein
VIIVPPPETTGVAQVSLVPPESITTVGVATVEKLVPFIVMEVAVELSMIDGLTLVTVGGAE